MISVSQKLLTMAFLPSLEARVVYFSTLMVLISNGILMVLDFLTEVYSTLVTVIL